MIQKQATGKKPTNFMVQWIQNEKMNSKAAARIIPIQRLKLKNPRNPVNPDSKPGNRKKPDYPNVYLGTKCKNG